MKDLEKIKSEDLGCQVQDANPGNFAIEQEVAQLVGATVPAPTEPSADDARELGAQLLVFLRRALLPIRSALRTAVAAIYAHLDSRCTDYTPAAYAPFRILPYDPMTTPRVPRTLPNLLQAITAFDSRKISNGSAPSDGIPDGISLAHLLCSTDAANAVTEIVDDNYGWDANAQGALQRMMQIFTTCRDFTLNCKKATANLESEFYNSGRTYNIHFPYLTDIGDVRVIGQYYVDREPTFNVYLDALETTNQTINTYSSFYARRIYIPNYKKGVYRQGGSATYSNPHTIYMLVGCKGAKNELVRVWSYVVNSVTDFEIADGACMSISLSGFDNLTAENMYNHILLRLKQDEAGCGSGVTITLGSTNIAKLEAVDEYNTKLTELEDTYGYTFA